MNTRRWCPSGTSPLRTGPAGPGRGSRDDESSARGSDCCDCGCGGAAPRAADAGWGAPIGSTDPRGPTPGLNNVRRRPTSDTPPVRGCDSAFRSSRVVAAAHHADSDSGSVADNGRRDGPPDGQRLDRRDQQSRYCRDRAVFHLRRRRCRCRRFSCIRWPRRPPRPEGQPPTFGQQPGRRLHRHVRPQPIQGLQPGHRRIGGPVRDHHTDLHPHPGRQPGRVHRAHLVQNFDRRWPADRIRQQPNRDLHQL
jgi:hypothetical protein